VPRNIVASNILTPVVLALNVARSFYGVSTLCETKLTR